MEAHAGKQFASEKIPPHQPQFGARLTPAERTRIRSVVRHFSDRCFQFAGSCYRELDLEVISNCLETKREDVKLLLIAVRTRGTGIPLA